MVCGDGGGLGSVRGFRLMVVAWVSYGCGTLVARAGYLL